MIRFHGIEAQRTFDILASLHVVSTCELLLMQSALAERALAACLDHADSIHLHVKLDDTEQLPHAGIKAAGGVLDHARVGYVKYCMPGGINAIFSHIPVSQDDLRGCESSRRPRPFLDHIGIDVRALHIHSRAAFEALPMAAAALGWAHVVQGGSGQPVRCCHIEVEQKHWLYPNAKGARPVEIALGPLRHGAGIAGCDLRPTHPALAQQGGCCAA